MIEDLIRDLMDWCVGYGAGVVDRAERQQELEEILIKYVTVQEIEDDRVDQPE